MSDSINEDVHGNPVIMTVFSKQHHNPEVWITELNGPMITIPSRISLKRIPLILDELIINVVKSIQKCIR